MAAVANNREEFAKAIGMFGVPFHIVCCKEFSMEVNGGERSDVDFHRSVIICKFEHDIGVLAGMIDESCFGAMSRCI